MQYMTTNKMITNARGIGIHGVVIACKNKWLGLRVAREAGDST